MDFQFLKASAFMLTLNMFYAIAGFVLSVVTILAIDRIFLRRLCLQEEIRKGNMAAAVFAAALVVSAVFAVSRALGK